MEITYSTGLYDEDGDIIDESLLLCFDDRFYLRFEDYDELQNVIKQMLVCYTQAQGNLIDESDVVINIALRGELSAVDDGMYGLYEEVVEALARAYGIPVDAVNPNSLVVLIDGLEKRKEV